MSGSRSFDYVRRYYGVPAKRGMRVTVDGKPGRITSGYGHYIRVLFDGERKSRIAHPTWRVEYLLDEAAAPVAPGAASPESPPSEERTASDAWEPTSP